MQIIKVKYLKFQHIKIKLITIEKVIPKLKRIKTISIKKASLVNLSQIIRKTRKNTKSKCKCKCKCRCKRITKLKNTF